MLWASLKLIWIFSFMIFPKVLTVCGIKRHWMIFGTPWILKMTNLLWLLSLIKSVSYSWRLLLVIQKTFTLEETEQQGTILGPLKCYNQMDSVSRECIRDDLGLYLYRGVLRLSALGMIDDLACAAKCGFASVKINAIINWKINAKRLQFNKNNV